MTVQHSGWYKVEVSGAEGGWGLWDIRGTGGRLTILVYFDSGDVLQAKVIAGGVGGYTNGGSAVSISCNTEMIVGAGGGGGGSDGSSGAGSTVIIDNSLFAGGVGGGAGYFGTAGKAGQNYLGRGIVLEQPNGSATLSFSVSYFDISNLPSSINSNIYDQITERHKAYRCDESGRYFIYVHTKTGYAYSAFIELNKDDIISYGTYHSNTAYLMLNEQLIAVFGTSTNISYESPILTEYNTTRILPGYLDLESYSKVSASSTGEFYIGSNIISLPLDIGVSVNTSINRLYKANENSLYHITAKSLNGDTVNSDILLSAGDALRVVRILNSLIIFRNDLEVVMIVASPGGLDPALYGNPISVNTRSYVNDSLLTRIEVTPTTTQEFLVTITCKSEWEDTTIGDLGKGVNDILLYLADIKSLLGQSSNSVPFIYAIKGIKFDYTYAGYDDLDSIVDSGLTIVNSVKGDGYIDVSGTFHIAGTHKIIIQDKLFIIKVVVEPDSQSVTTLL